MAYPIIRNSVNHSIAVGYVLSSVRLYLLQDFIDFKDFVIETIVYDYNDTLAFFYNFLTTGQQL
ncbi:25871_t:CDS:2 [Gigaspora margarita]|uniref:25871_t:CDS:1 n=1 Tax=Gigaspora margarita TaxID=4874 RepID=A0ABN7UH71_GIGMA|nr:25871_t:CDS:2 [Gigaspora margarita]